MRDQSEARLFASILGEHIRIKRQSMDLTQEELAFNLDCDAKHLGKIEQGRKNPSGFLLTKIMVETGLLPEDYYPTFLREREYLEKE